MVNVYYSIKVYIFILTYFCTKHRYRMHIYRDISSISYWPSKASNFNIVTVISYWNRKSNIGASLHVTDRCVEKPARAYVPYVGSGWFCLRVIWVMTDYCAWLKFARRLRDISILVTHSRRLAEVRRRCRRSIKAPMLPLPVPQPAQQRPSPFFRETSQRRRYNLLARYGISYFTIRYSTA